MAGDQFIEIDPYTEETLPTQPALVVYHQGDEESTAILHADGTIELRGPNDWFVNISKPIAALAELARALAAAKDRFDHAEAPYVPEVLALIRADEQLLAALSAPEPQAGQ